MKRGVTASNPICDWAAPEGGKREGDKDRRKRCRGQAMHTYYPTHRGKTMADGVWKLSQEDLFLITTLWQIAFQIAPVSAQLSVWGENEQEKKIFHYSIAEGKKSTWDWKMNVKKNQFNKLQFVIYRYNFPT